MIAATATVAALAVIGTVAIKNPKIQEMALAGKNTIEATLSKDASKWTYESLYRDSLKKGEKVDFNHLKVMREMDRESVSSQLRQRRQAKEATRKMNEQFRRREFAQRKKAVQDWAKKQRFNLETNRLLREEAAKRRRWAKLSKESAADLLKKSSNHRSRYTQAGAYWKRTADVRGFM